MKVAVAMSGGVDSSTVAGLLVEAGHEVVGLAMKTHDTPPGSNRACCTPDDLRDARRVADSLAIPFYVINYTDLFRSQVIEPFAHAYLQGKTPNPCIECNDRVKFRPLLRRAKLLGAEVLATGHYARIVKAMDSGEAGEQWQLRRGVDASKDQSYFLYRLDGSMLTRLWFPLGGMTKSEVRRHAARLGLEVADKPESQEICFVGAAGYAATVEQISGLLGRPGAIVDGEGRTVGRHRGVHHYTLGQRRGLGIAAPSPLYVTGIDAGRCEVRVGPRSDLLASRIAIEATHWIGPMPSPGEIVAVQQRYRDTAKPARLVGAAQGLATIELMAPGVRGASGQAAVLYQGDRVLGGGTITESIEACQVDPKTVRHG